MMRPSTSLGFLTVALSVIVLLMALQAPAPADAFVVQPSAADPTRLSMSSIANDSHPPSSQGASSNNIGTSVLRQLWRRRRNAFGGQQTTKVQQARVSEDLLTTTTTTTTTSVPKKQARAGLSSKAANAKTRSLPNVFYATTPEECQSIAAEHLDTKLTVFQFSSPTCQACAHAAPRFDRMAKTHEDLNFVYLQVSGRNRDFVVRELGIPSLPYAGLFHPEHGMVETASVKSAALFRHFAATVETYRTNECAVAYDRNEETGQLECRPAV